MMEMAGAIFCEQRRIATEFGFLEVPKMKKPPEGGCSRTVSCLTFGELLAAARLAQADFFAFHFARIAGDQSGLAQHRL